MEQTRLNECNAIVVLGARVHNLKNIDVTIPRGTLTVITGLSGSGKSSLAFDTIYAEGQRRYIETFSSYARGFIGNMARPDVDKISGLSPVIAIEQKTTNKNPRSTVGTTTEVYDFMRLLYARAATAYSMATGEEMVRYTEEQILELISHDYAGKRAYILAPLVQHRKGHYRELFENIVRKGFLHVRVDGEIMEVTPGMKLDRYKNHNIELVVDRLKVPEANGANADIDTPRLRKSVETAMRTGDGMMMICDAESGRVRHYSRRLMCPTTGMAYREPAPHTFSFNSPIGACPCCKGLGVLGLDEKANSDDDDDTEKKENTSVRVCPECHGSRLNKEALAFRIADKNIAELSAMDIETLSKFMDGIEPLLSERQRKIAPEILKEIRTRLHFMLDVGLGYLSLGRATMSLSGGESQRIRLATQMGSQLVSVLYILDEPSIGLHQRDNIKLINSLKKLRDAGNTVIVVEHDEEMMRAADYVIDIGPRAGRLGGKVTFQGKIQGGDASSSESQSLTLDYLSGKLRITPPEQLRSGNGKHLVIKGARGNNLKDVTLDLPLGKLTVVTGVSGSGKSTLINDTLYPILSKRFYRSLRMPLAYESIEGMEHIDKVVNVDQSPLGRTPRSNPATYTGVFTDIRALFINLPESKIRGYRPGRFSFNLRGGRCEACNGNGYKTIEMNFLPDVCVPCEECQGKRYNRETLEVRFKGKSIADVLDMTINQAVEFFAAQPNILSKIQVLQDVGLGYIKLGQPSTTLSGGESQRVKLATELARPGTGRTLYILDEPTTGLHFDDIRVLLNVLNRLVDKGNTVVVIEHNLDVIRSADHIIDMGPEGGNAGGQIIATGTPREVAMVGSSHTAKYL